MKKIVLALAVVLGVSVVASNSFSMGYFDQSKKIEELENDIALLREASKRTFEKIVAQNNKLEEEVERQMTLNRYFHESLFGILRMFPSESQISLGERTHYMLATKGMLVTVAFIDIKAHSTGSKLTLQFLNHYTVINSDAIVKITYSKQDSTYDETLSKDELSKKILDHEKFKKIKTLKIQELEPGIASDTVFFLPDYKPDEIKYVSVSIEAGGIRYSKRPNKKN